MEITPIAVNSNFGLTHTYPRIAFTPDARTVFVATTVGIFVQAVP